MSVNVKLGTNTINNVNTIELKNADSINSNITFVPVTKIEVGKMYIHFDFYQDYTGDGTRKIKWCPVIITMSSWASGAGWQYIHYTTVGDWKTYSLTTSDTEEIIDDIVVEVNSSILPTTSDSYCGYGILIDLSNSKYDYLNTNYYYHYGDTYVQDILNPLNGYNVNKSGSSGVCANDVPSTNSNSTLRTYKSSHCERCENSSSKNLPEKFSVIMHVDCCGAYD